MTNKEHQPVLLSESLKALELKSHGFYLDATFGRGGHSRAILAQLGENGRLFALDRDAQAAEVAKNLDDRRFAFAKRPFSQMRQAFSPEQGWKENSLDGVLFDLGVSSPQLDQAERGFSFSKEGPLDMRMDQEAGITAQEWLMQHDERELARIIRDLGGETHNLAKRIARAVYAARTQLHSTVDLARVVFDAVPKKLHRPSYHPATQTFQALRMAVNNEIGEIEAALQAAVDLLKSGGILAVISFHSGEDAVVKRFIRSQEGQVLPAEIPLTTKESARSNAVLKLLDSIKPSSEEILVNPRSRSARLRKAVKL